MPQPPATQAEVRRTMLDAGGYWRPLAAVARLLEELGELVELLGSDGREEQAIASELADLWIITTALADQFRIAVAEPVARSASTTEPSPAPLVVAAGEIGRVVNFYDGPKVPRVAAELPSLTVAIAAFHEALMALCGALEVDLAGAVSAKLEVIRGRDMERFAREDTDPSTAAVLRLLDYGAASARMWGAPATDPKASATDLAEALAPTLATFTKAALPEGLEGYVIPAPSPPGSEDLERWLELLLSALGLLDPLTGVPASFNGLALDVEVLPAAGTGARALVLLRPAER